MRLLDECAAELGLKVGMPVMLYYKDPSEEFEVPALLDLNGGRWVALPDWNAVRRLRS
jgi:hypothetical protein